MASLCMFRAIHAYHADQDPKVAVAAQIGQAVSVLRGVLIPATKSGGTPPRPIVAPAGPAARRLRVPAKDAFTTPVHSKRVVSDGKPLAAAKGRAKAGSRQVSDSMPQKGSPSRAAGAIVTEWHDIQALAQLLQTTVALAGLLGLTMQRIDLLKVARAVLRGRSERIAREAFLSLSGVLGGKYAALGKWTRARSVLEHAVRLGETGEGDGEEEVVKEVLGLRWCRFLAQTGRVDEA